MKKDNTNLKIYINWQISRCIKLVKTLEEPKDRMFFRGQKFAYEKILSMIEDPEKLKKVLENNRLEFYQE